MSGGGTGSMPRSMVIKIGGSTLEDIGSLSALWSALAAMASAESGTRPVLVHGGGKAVDALLARLALPTQRREGLRVTPPDQIDLIAGVLAGAVNKRLVGAINAAGGSERGSAVGLCLGDGRMLDCAVMTQTAAGVPVDLGRVGVVAGGSAGLVTALLREGYLPVVSSIGIDAQGGLLNINADDAAAALAGSLRSSHLVLLTDVPGVRGRDGQTVPVLSGAQAEAMIASGEITGGMIVKVRSAVHASRATGARVVILSGESPDALRAYLNGQPVGTTLHAELHHRTPEGPAR